MLYSIYFANFYSLFEKFIVILHRKNKVVANEEPEKRLLSLLFIVKK